MAFGLLTKWGIFLQKNLVDSFSTPKKACVVGVAKGYRFSPARLGRITRDPSAKITVGIDVGAHSLSARIGFSCARF